MATLVLVRHGQSMWNAKNLFTGWVDVPLSRQGIVEAINAGKQIAAQPFDMVFTSSLMRAQQTAMLMLSEQDSSKTPVVQHQDPTLQGWGGIFDAKNQADCLPIYIDYRLNERYYGELQGLDKDQTREKYGEDQVKIWRRSFDVPPPNGESLKLTAERTLPFFNEQIVPVLRQGKNVLIAAHGNSLRSIMMQLDQLNEETVLQLEIATGTPIIYQFDESTQCFTKETA